MGGGVLDECMCRRSCCNVLVVVVVVVVVEIKRSG